MTWTKMARAWTKMAKGDKSTDKLLCTALVDIALLYNKAQQLFEWNFHTLELPSLQGTSPQEQSDKRISPQE